MRITKTNLDTLVSTAIKASKNAYAPYSKYKVGAAVLCKDGTFISGCNVENSSYPVGICAEVNALSTAISENQKDFLALAVATKDMGTPCGNCRQFIFEFAQDLPIYICNFEGDSKKINVKQLLPKAFKLNA